jgi:hypothetical protein
MRIVSLLSVVLFALTGCAAHRPTVAFMSDFGTTDDSVAVCKGEMIRAEPDVRVIDITHQVTPYDVAEAARFLAGSVGDFPAGTVFVCVVDPGVGSDRKPIAVKTASGQIYVGPDNGLVSLVPDLVEAREITNTQWMHGGMRDGRRSSTFHGRDIFSPVGAHLAGGDDFALVGPIVPLDQLVKLNVTSAGIDAGGLHGDVVGLDGPYGNLVTNVSGELFAQLGYRLGDSVPITIDSKPYTLPFVRTFSDVPEGKPLLYIDSRGRLSAAINMGDFAKTNGITPPVKLSLTRRAK